MATDDVMKGVCLRVTSRTIVRTSFIFRSTELTSIEYVYSTMRSRQRSAPE